MYCDASVSSDVIMWSVKLITTLLVERWFLFHPSSSTFSRSLRRRAVGTSKILVSTEREKYRDEFFSWGDPERKTKNGSSGTQMVVTWSTQGDWVLVRWKRRNRDMVGRGTVWGWRCGNLRRSNMCFYLLLYSSPASSWLSILSLSKIVPFMGMHDIRDKE